MSVCAQCSAQIALNDRFCGNCGAPASSDGDAAQNALSPVEAASAATDETPGSSMDEAELQATLITPSPVASEPTAEPPPEPDAPVEKRATTGERAAENEKKDDEFIKPLTRKSAQKKGALEPGTLLNRRYEIVRRLGGGGMGAVYLATDKNLGDAPRAVKEMIQARLDEDQQAKAIEDFKRESMLLASLEHPSIPTIYDYFYDELAGRFYLVMKYISGGDLQAYLVKSPGHRVDERLVTEWAIQVADVLDYLHSRTPPIIYRDLKPANLMLDGNSGRIMLIDFGIARWVAPQEKGVTAVGTMGYAPPELFSGRAQPATDLYSLGATMFHLLTGADPQDNPLLIFDFTKNPRPRQINPNISNEMEQIVMRAVEYQPEDRFASAAEMRAALMAHLERLQKNQATFETPLANPAISPVVAPSSQLETVFCGFCGGRIAADDLFCAHCGARQPIANQVVAPPARATARLVVMGTKELDSSFQLIKESNLVGRSDPISNIFPEVDLSRFDPQTKVSRRHARIWREGATYLVEDLGSVNGTIINEAVRLVPRQPRALSNGDRLRLGETVLAFVVN
jgi:serine/threonine protein kinase